MEMQTLSTTTVSSLSRVENILGVAAITLNVKCWIQLNFSTNPLLYEPNLNGELTKIHLQFPGKVDELWWRSRVVRDLNKVAYLRKLLGDVAPHKHGLQVDPQVLNGHPVLYDVRGVGQILDPLLNLPLKGSVVSGGGGGGGLAINKG